MNERAERRTAKAVTAIMQLLKCPAAKRAVVMQKLRASILAAVLGYAATAPKPPPAASRD